MKLFQACPRCGSASASYAPYLADAPKKAGDEVSVPWCRNCDIRYGGDRLVRMSRRGDHNIPAGLYQR